MDLLKVSSSDLSRKGRVKRKMRKKKKGGGESHLPPHLCFYVSFFLTLLFTLPSLEGSENETFSNSRKRVESAISNQNLQHQ